jgi:hypothetical protein
MDNPYKKNRPSFFEGAAYLLDLGGNLSRQRLANIIDNYNSIEVKSAEESLREDWESVGHYILAAMNEFDKSYAKKG